MQQANFCKMSRMKCRHSSLRCNGLPQHWKAVPIHLLTQLHESHLAVHCTSPLYDSRLEVKSHHLVYQLF